MDLRVKIGKLTLQNPVMTASGTFGYGEEYADFVDLNLLGAVVVKGISIEPMHGNPSPRICETPCGMLNAIGLQNVGLRTFLKEKLPYLKKFRTKVIVNILGQSLDEYVTLARSLDAEGIDGIELNVSCPNVKKGGIMFGTDRKILGDLVSKVRKVVKNAVLITKLSPNTTHIRKFAEIAEKNGSDAVSLINTIPGMAIDINTWSPKLANQTGGLSGPAIKPVALKMVWDANKGISIPIIGIGGIMTAEDTIEFMLAGATAVAVGTANFINPTITIDIVNGIKKYLKKKRISDIKELIGGARGIRSCSNPNH
jgi:dihydroorotate dehydrogenase (NAD+) catalytic subunit